jgi:DNA-binding transcriptional LysR family regulator
MQDVHMRSSPPLALNLNLMVALEALLRERNVTRAAKQIGLSQSATSHALARLRVALGDELLVRGPSGLELTERARAIGPQLARTLAELGAILRPPEAFAPETFAGELTIATGDFIAAAIGARLAALLARVSPGSRVRFVALDAKKLATGLDDQTVDLALGPASTGPASTGTASVARAPWGSTPFVCAVRRHHPALSRKTSLARYCALSHLQIAPTGRLRRRRRARRARPRAAGGDAHGLVPPRAAHRGGQ